MKRDKSEIKTIVIAGGGTAGWMSAAALAKLVAPQGIKIKLVESDQIGTVGVGEATLPHLRFFNRTLGIDERELIKATNATIKLGIEFCDWGQKGDSYIHPFGDYGREIQNVEFHHYWSRHVRETGGAHAAPICDWSLPVIMAQKNKFALPSSDPDQIMSSFSFAYQFDATAYAAYLSRFAQDKGVERIEGKITQVVQDGESGLITGLEMENGTVVHGDFFIDCTGFRSLLMNGALDVDFEDWSKWLPCDRAVAVPCEGDNAPQPYTRATAQDAGWTWRIPLQHRIGNGHVYCSDYMSDDNALETLLGGLEGKPTRDPKFLKFKAGRRVKSWEKNCVAVGLSGGFLEPLESTSIYLIQAAITHFIELLPAMKDSPDDRDEFNRIIDLETDRIRDFLILHYHATQRDDTPFWNYVRTMDVPESLKEKMALFKQAGIVQEYRHGLFLHASWVAVYLGQRIVPDASHPAAQAVDPARLAEHLSTLRHSIAQTVDALPDHRGFLDEFCNETAA